MIVREAALRDAPELCALLNEIIVIGGSTAMETRLTSDEFTKRFLVQADFVGCLVAEQDGKVLGFQAVERRAKLPVDCADTATFARASNKVKGVGRSLFAHTVVLVRDAGFKQINATIRADNASGLGYYAAMGFVDFAVKPAVPLADGSRVDRISKRFNL